MSALDTLIDPIPYAQAAPGYRAAGWPGVLPLPPRKKHQPPSGYTGPDAATPTSGDVARWVAERPDANIALRLPDGIVGIDIDHYGDKRGGDTLADLEARLGPLPPTWRSTSRGPDNLSGIRFYRVPPGVRLRGQAGPHIDIIQPRHRYAVVAPSIHPEGREYVWLAPDGNVAHGVPTPDDLPALPDAWLDHLRADNTPDPILDRRATTRRAASGRSPAVDRALGRAITDMRGGRHDAATAGAMALARLEELGHPGATAALDSLGDVFLSMVTRDGSRSEREARGEWHRIVTSAHHKAATTPSTVPTYDEAEAERQAAHEARRAAQAEERAAFDEIVSTIAAARPASDDPLETWQPIDLTDVLAGNIEPPKPSLLTTRDGATALLYRGAVNGFHGDSGIGKSWLLHAATAERLNLGETVMLIDAEANAAETVARLRALAVPDQTIAERLIYIAPNSPADDEAIDRLVALVAERDVTLVGIDSVGELFGLEGIDENADREVGTWMRRIPRTLAEAGAAVVLIDHATKAADNALHPSGSKRKRAAITGAAYLVEAIKAPTRTEPGRLKVTCAKDRHGTHQRGKVIVHVDVTPYPDGGVTVNIWPTNGQQDSADARVRLVARKLVAFARAEAKPLSQNELLTRSGVTGKTDVKRAALDYATRLGCLAEQRGERNARLFAYVRDLPDELDDLAAEATSPHLAPPRPDLARAKCETPRTTSPPRPPFRGARSKSGDRALKQATSPPDHRGEVERPHNTPDRLPTAPDPTEPDPERNTQ